MAQPYRDEEVVLRERLERLREERDGLDVRRRQVDAEIVAIERHTRWWNPVAHSGSGCVGVASLMLAMTAAPIIYFWFFDPCFRVPKTHAARRGAEVIRIASELHLDTVEDDASACPSVGDLVAAKALDPKKKDDPWGRPYRIQCDADGIHVVSLGKDGRPYTGDEIADSFDQKYVDALSDR